MTAPHYQDDRVTIHHGDCLNVLAALPDNSVDAVVTDPPYGLGFMGKAWDDLPPGLPWAEECLRVLKPGGHLLAFGGTRTWHRLAVAVEDAGFEVRDSIAWLYGSGFPKSLDVSKAIDKLDATDERRARALEFTAWFRSTGITRQQAAEVSGMASVTNHYFEVTAQPSIATADIFDKLRPYLPQVPARIEELVRLRTVESQNFKARPVTGTVVQPDSSRVRLGFVGETYNGDAAGATREVPITTGHTPAAQQWAGWGTALKPAFEPIVVARKPLVGTVAANVQAYGTGALNIDATRVGDSASGRWPTNVTLDDATAAELDARTGTDGTTTHGAGVGKLEPGVREGYNDSGGASRFFPVFKYQAKAPARERPTYTKDGAGTGRVTGLGDKVRQCNICESRAINSGATEPSCGHGNFRWEEPTANTGNKVAHPTCKPLTLMQWLVRLVVGGRPDAIVLDPFAGSGTTAEACLLEGVRCIAVERDADYLPLIDVRIARAYGTTTPADDPTLFDDEAAS